MPDGMAGRVAGRLRDRADQHHADPGEREKPRRHRIGAPRLDGISISAQRGACDHAGLPCHAGNRDSVGQHVARDQIGGERRIGRSVEGPCNADDGGNAKDQRQADPPFICRERQQA